MDLTRKPTSVAQAALLLLGLSALPMAVQAALPSVEAVANFTAAQPGGGNGARPVTPLVEAADGYLYSRTATGGGTINNSSQGGTSAVFYRIRNDGTGFEVLATGDATVAPTSTRWIAGSDGYLYSPMTAGLIQRYKHNTTTGWEDFHTLSSAQTVTSIHESGGLFYLAAGASSISSLSLPARVETPLFTLTNAGTEGSAPREMLRGSDGRLYGINTSGGPGSNGTLFSLNSDGADYRVLQSFNNTATGSPGIFAVRLLVEAGDGKLYGITYSGNGDYTRGGIYRIDRNGDNFEMIYGFATPTDRGGANPNNILLGRDGHLYISTINGGANGVGTILRYRIDDGVLELLYTFEAATGPAQNNVWTNPTTGATATSNVALNGGSNAGGRFPYHLMQASNGQFYGITQQGGSHGWGTVFRFHPGDEVAPGSMLNDVPPEMLGFGINVSHQPSATVIAGRSVDLFWNTKGVSSCTAFSNEPGSAWTGRQATKATGGTSVVNLTLLQPGAWTYTLTCLPQNPVYAAVSASITIQVEPAVTDPQPIGNGGGGALGGLLAPLAALGGLALLRRRRAR